MENSCFLAGVNTDLLLDTSMECFRDLPGFLGFDHGIDIAFRGGHVRIGEFSRYSATLILRISSGFSAAIISF